MTALKARARKPAPVLAPDVRTPAVPILPASVRSAQARERARGIGEARPSVRAGAGAGPTKPGVRVAIGNHLLF